LGFAAAALLAALVSATMTVLIATNQTRTFGADVLPHYWSVHLASALVLVTALIALAARLMLQPARETDAERGWLILGYVIIAAALFVAPVVMVLRQLSPRWNFGIAAVVSAGLLALAALVSWRQLRAQPRDGRLRLASLIVPTIVSWSALAVMGFAYLGLHTPSTCCPW
jgi:hypothetical protein